MITFLEKISAAPKGTIQFLYHDNSTAPAPNDYSDPLALLGDIQLLRLNNTQKETLRTLVQEDIYREGIEEVWRTRALRKNVIHSFGILV